MQQALSFEQIRQIVQEEWTRYEKEQTQMTLKKLERADSTFPEAKKECGKLIGAATFGVRLTTRFKKETGEDDSNGEES